MFHLNCESAGTLFETRRGHDLSFVDSLPLHWDNPISFRLGDPTVGGIQVHLSPSAKGTDVELDVHQDNLAKYGQLVRKWSERGPTILKRLTIQASDSPEDDHRDDLQTIIRKFLLDFGSELVYIRSSYYYSSGPEFPLAEVLKACPKIRSFGISKNGEGGGRGRAARI